jgi:multiple antibiotic resistance protein
MTLLSATIILILVMDPFGNIPFFLVVLQTVDPARRMRVVFREMLIALAILLVFLAGGPSLLSALHISEPSLRIAGGVILFLIATRMIFGTTAGLVVGAPEGEPFIVPLAVPSIAGPSAIATVLLLVAQEPDRWPLWLLAVMIAWAASSLVLSLSVKLERLLGRRGLNALQRLMGLILTTFAVEMFVQGVKSVVREGL